MEDLNCPRCGTTQLKKTPGYCDCCGYEFTSEYINQFLAEQRKKEDDLKRKAAEEDRKKRIQQQIELEKEKAKKREQKKALESAAKERAERERTRRLIERDNKRYSRELKYSGFFNRLQNVVSKIALVTAIAAIVVSVFVSRGDWPQSPLSEIEIKAHEISNFLTLQRIRYDDESGMFYERKGKNKSSDDVSYESTGLSYGLIKLLNSISTIINNRTDIEDKIEFVFPFVNSLKA